MGNRILLHAPNVHSGGGLRLLLDLLSLKSTSIAWVQVDERIRSIGFVPDGVELHFVKRSVMSRLAAELRLRRECRGGDAVLCFHGLPPLFALRARVVIFLQNRLLIESGSLANYSFWEQIRLGVERIWSRALQGHCSRYIVQTPSMANALNRWLRREVPVSIVPFAPVVRPGAPLSRSGTVRKFDFVYVASGEAHKNHRNLLSAWCLLAKAGQRPSLALTIDPVRSPGLSADITGIIADHGLQINNLGSLSHDAVDNLYRAAGAMIYPSAAESFGLPLVEASRHGLPILASERDYVRDVVEPVETFDPESPVSIARAVRRFLGVAEPPVAIGTAADFLAEVLR